MNSESFTISSDSAAIGEMALVVERANAQRDAQPLPEALKDSDIAADLRTRLAKPGAWIYIAETGYAVTGLALGYPAPETDDKSQETEHLSLLFVDPAYWGNRIASRLLDTVAANANSKGKQHLTLWTRQSNNEHARSVYEHKGFSLTNRTRRSMHGDQVEYKLDL